jgi:UDP-GlcNAc:undecaprenyl-phosphate GlcNAc-1-phosphate transferase
MQALTWVVKRAPPRDRMHLLVLFAAALSLSSLLTHYIRNLALRRRWACPKVRQRDVHRNPIPRVGGIAIYATFMVCVVPYVIAERLLGTKLGFGYYNTFAVLAPACLMFVLGLVDDLHSVSPRVKFGVQIIAGLLLFYGGVRIWVFPTVSGYHELHGAISAVLTVFWVLLISNAFNLIDGLDGLSAGSALFSTLVVFVVSLLSGNAFVAIVTVSLAGAILGFLRYNFNPATVFLGDSGSLFLGFMLSAVSLNGGEKGTTAIAVAIPIVAFGLPVLDTVLSIFRRYLSGQPLFGADREHIHHKLLKRGFTHKQAVVLLYGVSAGMGMISLLLLHPSGKLVAIVLTVLGIGVAFGVQHLGYHEFAELGRAAKRTVDQKDIIINNLAVRRAIEDIASADDLPNVCAALRTAFENNEFDGFELMFRPAMNRESRIPATFISSFDGRFCYEWHKAEAARQAGGWQLTLALRGPLSGQEGAFTVYRNDVKHNLRFDINMLMGDFQSVLSEALDRALETRVPEAMLTPVALQNAGLAAMSD